MSNRFDLRTLISLALLATLAFSYFYDQEKESSPGPHVQVLALDKHKRLIAIKETKARMEHGWVAVQGAGSVVASQK